MQDYLQVLPTMFVEAYVRSPPVGEVKRAWINTAITVVVLLVIWGLAELGYWQIGIVLVLGVFVYLLWSIFTYFQRAKARVEERERGSSGQPPTTRS